jgi:S1-C subfamily serine protease
MTSSISRIGLLSLLALAAMPVAEAQRKAASNIPPDLSFLTPEVNAQLESQAGEFYGAVAPSVATVADSTVWIRAGKRVLAMGTVIGDGTEVLTKWSEVATRRNGLEAVGGDGEARAAKVVGVYVDYDLARLKLTGKPLVPLAMDKPVVPALGSFLVAARPDKVPVSIGVAGVMPRSLRDADRAFIGVTLDAEHSGAGARIKEVSDESPAKTAGLQPGDIILAIGNDQVGGLFELQNRLATLKPGDVADLRVQRANKEERFAVTLAARSKMPAFPRQRLDVMERMGGDISRVRSGFPQVLETDMFLKPNEAGGPVVDLDGNFVGLTLARASRVRSFIVPAANLEALLKTEATDPQIALRSLTSEAQSMQFAEIPVPSQERRNPNRTLRDLAEVRRLMGLMDNELRRADEPGR